MRFQEVSIQGFLKCINVVGRCGKCLATCNQAYLPFTRITWKFWLENEMVYAIPFETFQKLQAIDLINAFFLFLLNFPIDTNTFSDLCVWKSCGIEYLHLKFPPGWMDGVNGPDLWKWTIQVHKPSQQKLVNVVAITGYLMKEGFY